MIITGAAGQGGTGSQYSHLEGKLPCNTLYIFESNIVRATLKFPSKNLNEK